MEPINIFVLIGIIFSIIAFGIALGLVIKAISAEKMKRAQRKRLLQSAFVVLMNAIGYWVIIGLMFAFAHLAEVINEIAAM